MKVPKEFNDLCSLFHQDAMLMHATPEEMVAAAVQSMNGEQRAIVRRFLEHLLDERSSPGDARGIWRRSPAEIRFKTSRDARAFLEIMRDALAERQRLPD